MAESLETTTKEATKPANKKLVIKSKPKVVSDFSFFPKILSLQERDDRLEMEILDVDRSIVNSLRRTVLTQVPILVFRGFPHAKNQIQFIKNTSKFNN